jgi:hypothetical protein
MPRIGLFSWPKSAILKCAAMTRTGEPCKRRGVGKGGRCRNHGGMSTGPKTEKGLERISRAQRIRWNMYRSRKKHLQAEALHARFDAAHAAHQAKVEAKANRRRIRPR